MSPLDGYIKQLAKAIDTRENYQRIVGEIAYTVTDLYGGGALHDLASAVTDATGRSCSVSTLRNYRYVWERINTLDLPEDLSFHTLQLIAGSGDPEGWAKRIKEEGLTSTQVHRLFQEKKPKKLLVCPSCGHEYTS